MSESKVTRHEYGIESSDPSTRGPRLYHERTEEGDSTTYKVTNEVGAHVVTYKGTNGESAEVASVKASATTFTNDDLGALDDNRTATETLQVSGTLFKGDTGTANKYVNGSIETFGASAEGNFGIKKFTIGGSATIIEGNARINLGADGNQFEIGAGVGAGIKGELRLGEDTDKDGYTEWGFRYEGAAGGKINLGLRIEPGAICDGIKELFGEATSKFRDRVAEVNRFLTIKRLGLAMERLQSLL